MWNGIWGKIRKNKKVPILPRESGVQGLLPLTGFGVPPQLVLSQNHPESGVQGLLPLTGFGVPPQLVLSQNHPEGWRANKKSGSIDPDFLFLLAFQPFQHWWLAQLC
jgi:hypothetical protein